MRADKQPEPTAVELKVDVSLDFQYNLQDYFTQAMATKSVIIGLDGATWTLLNQLMANGTMPTLAKLVREGSSATLRSTMPPYTAPAWTTFATGVNPGKHGCYDFLLPTDDLENFTLCNSSHIRPLTWYELLYRAGKKSILINLPNSYSVKLPTPTITDLLTVGNDCIHPVSLLEKYPVLKNYRLAPDEVLNIKGKTAEYIDDIIAVETGHMAAVQALWAGEPWDVFFYLFSSTDWISHAMFNRLLAGDAKAMELFKFIDEQLAWFVAHLPADTNLYILSDHGFKVYEHTFYFNKWLEQQGYLVTKSAPANQFHQSISKQDEQRVQLQQAKRFQLNIGSGTMRALSVVKPVEKLARWFYHGVVKPFLPIKINLDITIDFEHTQVCFPKGRTMAAIYINDGRNYRQGKPLTNAQYLKLRDEVIAKLKNLRGPDGELVTPQVYTKEEIYGNDVPERCPDIFYEFGNYWFVGQFHSSSLFVDELSNKHDPFGMFVAWGSDIVAQHLTEQSIAAVTPTMLHDLAQPVPTYMDAAVMPIFKTQRQIQTSAIPLVPERAALNALIDDITL